MPTHADNHAQAQSGAEAQNSTAASEGSHAEQASGIVRRNTYWALGLGLIPVPVIDFLALTGVQVKMLKELSALYGVSFSEQRAKFVVGSLITGLGSLGLTGLFARSLFKVIPGVGQLVGAVGASIFGGALTRSIGNLFTMHYESGGTLLDFDAAKMRAHFRQEFEKAKEHVKAMPSEPKAGAKARP